MYTQLQVQVHLQGLRALCARGSPINTENSDMLRENNNFPGSSNSETLTILCICRYHYM